jgi:hypothetical protein
MPTGEQIGEGTERTGIDEDLVESLREGKAEPLEGRVIGDDSAPVGKYTVSC